MNRDKFITRPILLRTEAQRDIIRCLVDSLPCDAEKPLEVVFREQVKARKLDQSALMWVGPLKDIAEQGYVHGRRYSAEVWHEYFKKEYLPEDNEFDCEAAGLVNDGYKKWDMSPSHDRNPVLIGSTTQLTIKGMAQYLEQIYAFGANIGVEFSANNKY